MFSKPFFFLFSPAVFSHIRVCFHFERRVWSSIFSAVILLIFFHVYLLECIKKVTEGVRESVLACVERSTNSEGRIVEVNAFADFFSKAISELGLHSLFHCVNALTRLNPFVNSFSTLIQTSSLQFVGCPYK